MILTQHNTLEGNKEMAEAQIGQLEPKKKPEFIYDKTYKHSLTASSYNEQRSFLSNVSGNPALVEYYRQVLDGSEAPFTLQPESIETYQSYTRIKGMIIKIDGDLNPTFDDDTGTMMTSGVAFVMSDLAPIIFDVFVMDIGDGKTALFHISTPPRIRTITMDKVYEVDFRSIAIMNKRIEENLNAKVIEDLVYSKDSAIRGGNAVISDTDFNDNKALNNFETLISRTLMENFYYHPERTIILPKVGTSEADDDLRYDPYLAQFLQYTIPVRRLGLQDGIEVINTDVGRRERGGVKLTPWDMFTQNNFDRPEQYKSDYWVHHRDSLLNTRYYGGFFYCKLDTVILNKETGASKEAYRYAGPLMTMMDVRYDDGGVPKDGTPVQYYFSDEFYTGKPTKPNEKFIFDFFRDKIIDKKALLKILNDYWKMEPLDQLYMGGIYIRAIQISLSTTYNYL